MFIFSGILLVLFLVSIGVYCRIANGENPPLWIKDFNWIPIVLVICVYVTFSLGYGCSFLVLLGELFPSDMKTLGNSIVFNVEIIACTAILKISPMLLETIGIHGLFWMFSAVVLINTIFGFLFMPETNHLTLQEIQDNFLGIKRNAQNSLETKDEFKKCDSAKLP